MKYLIVYLRDKFLNFEFQSEFLFNPNYALGIICPFGLTKIVDFVRVNPDKTMFSSEKFANADFGFKSRVQG